MNGSIWLPVLVFLPIVGAFAVYLAGRKNKMLRDYLADAVVIAECLLAFVLFVCLPKDESLTFVLPEFCVRGLYLELDGFRSLYVLVASFMWMMTTIFTREYMAHYRNRNRYYIRLLSFLKSCPLPLMSG